jgi:hypothetical protein
MTFIASHQSRIDARAESYTSHGFRCRRFELSMVSDINDFGARAGLWSTARARHERHHPRLNPPFTFHSA